MALRFQRDETGAYRASNGVATFEIGKGERGEWFLSANRYKGGSLFCVRDTLREAKAAANDQECKAGWHKV